MDIICKCSHNKKAHFTKFREPGICMFLGIDTVKPDCPCMKYTPDNLTHIEELAKEKKLI
jgi:hypothetical protein